MSHNQSTRSPSPFRSRDWVLSQATEQQLLDYLHHLLLAQRAQQEELMALVEVMVEDRLHMQDEVELTMMEAWIADNAPPRTSWAALGLAGLAGYLIARSLD